MNFYSDQIFHVFNQGNNRQTIFYKDEHFEFFLWKMRAYVLPFGDFISYCLMPTHFHWQVYVRDTVIERKAFKNHVNYIEFKRRQFKYGANAKPIHFSASTKANEKPTISLNDSIGILQMAYTKAINQEKDWSGSLFRSDCKAKDGCIDEFITVTKSNGKPDPRFTGNSDYAFNCFEYIHNNPKEAGLVNDKIDWKFSSAREYAGLNENNICNLELGRSLIGIL